MNMDRRWLTRMADAAENIHIPLESHPQARRCKLGISLKQRPCNFCKFFTTFCNPCSQALRAAGVEFLVAPYEADAQLAYLAISRYVFAVITEDSDLLAYGCPRVGAAKGS